MVYGLKWLSRSNDAFVALAMRRANTLHLSSRIQEVMNDILCKAHENYCLSTLLLRTCHMQYCWLLMASIPSCSKRHPKQASRDAEQSRAKRTLRSATLHRLFFFAKAIAFASFATKQEATQNIHLRPKSPLHKHLDNKPESTNQSLLHRPHTHTALFTHDLRKDGAISSPQQPIYQTTSPQW